MSNAQPKFDHDLKKGQEGEKFLLMLGEESGVKVEVKSEQDIWIKSGNMFFEYSYRGKPSGFKNTEAEIWHTNFVVNGRIVGYAGFRTKELIHNLRRLVKEKKNYGVKTVSGGDNNWSEGVLVPISVIEELFKPIPKHE